MIKTSLRPSSNYLNEPLASISYWEGGFMIKSFYIFSGISISPTEETQAEKFIPIWLKYY